jgi:hypothetical protein
MTTAKDPKKDIIGTVRVLVHVQLVGHQAYAPAAEDLEGLVGSCPEVCQVFASRYPCFELWNWDWNCALSQPMHFPLSC